jgi:short-subunit dehydrogenase
LITGASRGVGVALARAFHSAGATAALVARSGPELHVLAEELHGSAHIADLADPGAVAELIDRVERDAGPVDVLVNNAGVEDTGAFLDTTNARIRAVTEVNYFAPAELCRQVIPRMLGRGGGHIVNISTMAACVPFPGLASYTASKAALSAFTAGLRADLRGLPIGITVVENGPIPTDLYARLRKYPPTAQAFTRVLGAHLVAEVPRDKVAAHVVRAVEKNRRAVRLPRRAAVFPWLAEIPTRVTEGVLTGIAHQDPHVDGQRWRSEFTTGKEVRDETPH